VGLSRQGGEKEGQPGRGACLGVGAPAIVSSDGGALLPAVGHGDRGGFHCFTQEHRRTARCAVKEANQSKQPATRGGRPASSVLVLMTNLKLATLES